MKVVVGVLMIIAGIMIATALRTLFGSAGWLGWFVAAALVCGGIGVIQKKS